MEQKEPTKIGKILRGIRYSAVTIVKGAVPAASPITNIIEHFTGKDLATGDKLENAIAWQGVALKLAGAIIMIYLWKQGVLQPDELVKFVKGLGE